MSYFFLLICCCLPIIFGFITVISILKVAIQSNKDKYTAPDALINIWNWMNIFTFRSIISLFVALIFFFIALYSEASYIPTTLLATMSVFLFSITSIFVIVALFAKIYISIKQKIFKKESSDVSLSKTEITENEPSSIKINLNAGIPPGYILKISEKLPEKLGGNIRALATNATSKNSIFEATIPLTKRGLYTIGPTNFVYQDVFGFSKIILNNNSRFSITILPEVPRIKKFEFKLSSIKGDDDQVVSALVNTEDYYGTRPYIRGDDLRKMHWKLTAKKNELIVRVAETTPISFRNLSIIIFNLRPSFSKTVKNIQKESFIPYKFINPIEYALDSQIKVAAGIIDFALRMNIPVKLYYFAKEGLKEFTPYLDLPSEWIHKLAKINYINRASDLQPITDILEENSACILTCSEINKIKIQELIEISKKKKLLFEIMYCPLSYHVEKIFQEQNDQKNSLSTGLIKLLSKIIFTSSYFEQKTISESIEDLLTKSHVKFNLKDIEQLKYLEQSIFEIIENENIPLRIFDNKNQYLSEIDNIINILEN